MDGIALLTTIARTNPTDIAAIEAQCGGLIGTIEMMAHINAIQASLNLYPNDTAKGLAMVLHNNIADVKYLFTDVGGLDGFLKIAPNLVNIYGTIEAHKQHGV
jgi:hypothetical protein